MSKSIKSHSRRQLFVALTLGLVAALGTYLYVDLNAGQGKMPKMVSVVVARIDIPAKARLSPEILATTEVPLATKHPMAVTSLSDAAGKTTAVPLTSGEQVLTTKFVGEKDEKLSLAHLIPPGMRAMAVTVNEVIGTGGLIVPGDRVDVIAVFDSKTMGKDEALIILQDVPVLAVAQAIEGDEEMPVQDQAKGAATQASSRGISAPGTNANSGSRTSNAPAGQGARTNDQEKATARPQARSATLAVTPEQSQRLALAEATGKIRLILRPAREATLVSLTEATLGQIREPAEMAGLVITSAEISPTNVKPGDVLTVRVTVKNTSSKLVRTQGPAPDFSYVQGQTYHSQDYPSQQGAYRVGVNFAGQSSAPFPYRWGFGGDLAPGASTTIEGHIKVTFDFKPTNFWVGVVREPADVVQDSVATTLVTSVPADIAVVTVDAANVRSGPGVSSNVIAQVAYGRELPILGQQNDWYKVRLEDGREGWVAAGWIITAAGR